MILDLEVWKQIAFGVNVRLSQEPDGSVHVQAPSLLRLTAFVILAGREAEKIAEKGPGHRGYG